MKIKYISWLPTAILMVTIFYFSSKPVENSNDSSLTLANGILTAYETITNQPIQVEVREVKLSFINHVVRKGAHFTEYALLAAAIAFHLSVWKHRGKRLLILPILIASSYAASDEFHQLFVQGRGGQVSDVILDSFGAITGTILFSFLYMICLKYRNLQRNKSTSLI